MSGQASSESSLKIPRDKDDDYRESVADARRRFVTERTGADLDHVAKYSIDPSILPGVLDRPSPKIGDSSRGCDVRCWHKTDLQSSAAKV